MKETCFTEKERTMRPISSVPTNIFQNFSTISGQLNSDCKMRKTVEPLLPGIPVSLSTTMSTNIPCQDLDFKGTFSYMPCTDMCQIYPGIGAFHQETPCQTDTYDVMTSRSHLNLPSPSFTSSSLPSPSQTASTHLCSFFTDCPQPELHPLHQHHQQYFQTCPEQQRSCLPQEADICNGNFITSFCNRNCSSDYIDSTINANHQHKTRCSESSSDWSHQSQSYIRDTNDNLIQDQVLDAVLDLSFLETYIGHTVSDPGADSAVSRSNSCSSLEDGFHQPYESDQQYDSYGYQSQCSLAENSYIKTENCGSNFDEGVTFTDDLGYTLCPHGCGSYPAECASYHQFFPTGNCPVASYTVKQSLDLQHISTRHGSPISDEGFDEPSIPEDNLPRFLNIPQFTDSDRDSHSSRSISSSPKEKRKIDGQLVPSCEKERRKPGRKPGQVSNVLHLWEFMRDLLHNVDGRGIIEWVSRQDGVFRVLNSSEVARLWGEKKKNKKQMTYEKLSRSLRYSRLEGYFADLPKDKNYPKKLCFKFGLKAKNWH